MSELTATGFAPGAPETSIQPYKQIVLYGDSITQVSGSQDLGFGFAPAFQTDYIRRLDVVNRGLSGYNTRQALRVIPWAIPTPAQGDVRLITIFFGANDATYSGHSQHVPLDEYQENLKKIVNHPMITIHKPQILLLTPPPVNEHQFMFPDRTAERTKTYADALKKTAQELNLPVVDIWSAFLRKAGWQDGDPLLGRKDVEESDKLKQLLLDGLHFTPAGYKVMYKEVTRTIREKLPDYIPEKFPMVLPPWNQY